MPKIGFRFSEESKIKMRESHLGKKAWNKGVAAPWAKNNPQIFKNGEHYSPQTEFKKGQSNPWYKRICAGVSLERKERIAGRSRPEQCEICGAFGSDTKMGIVFDHDHKTGKFRGWICGRCNTALGLVKDNIETLQEMIEYLKKDA